MSPMPTLRATSTSTLASTAYDERASTSLGRMPASSSAPLMAWQAMDSSEPGSDLANAVWPMPTMAARSLSTDVAYQPLNAAGRRSTKLATPSLESSVPLTASWAHDSSWKAVRRSESSD